LPCCGGSLLLRGVDECLTFLKEYRHVPSVVAVVEAFQGQGQYPSWGEQQGRPRVAGCGLEWLRQLVQQIVIVR
jgi:hypothetical protein